jgi:hypothetical protein
MEILRILITDPTTKPSKIDVNYLVFLFYKWILGVVFLIMLLGVHLIHPDYKQVFLWQHCLKVANL